MKAREKVLFRPHRLTPQGGGNLQRAAGLQVHAQDKVRSSGQYSDAFQDTISPLLWCRLSRKYKTGNMSRYSTVIRVREVYGMSLGSLYYAVIERRVTCSCEAARRPRFNDFHGFKPFLYFVPWAMLLCPYCTDSCLSSTRSIMDTGLL